MPTVVITGASRGLGLEFVRQYAADGWAVHACCRTPADIDAGGIGGDVTVHQLDVRDRAGLDGLGAALDGASIDLLINNAGVYGPRDAAFGHVDDEVWHEVLAINTMAPLHVTEALVENLAADGGGCVAVVTSQMGSIADNTSGGGYIYRSSKAALNAVMKSAAVDLAGRDITVLLLHPGWVQTDMGGPSAAITPEQSIAGLRNVIAGCGAAESGRFFNHDGTEIPW